VAFGTVTTVVLVTASLAAAFAKDTRFLNAALVAVFGGTVGTVVTILPMGSFTKLANIAGNGVMYVAVVWSVAWIVSVAICAVALCGCCGCYGKWGLHRWLVRSSAYAAFGLLLLPTVFGLKDDPTASTIIHSVMLVWMGALGEWGARTLVPDEHVATAKPVQRTSL
jgi:hypothetical protein